MQIRMDRWDSSDRAARLVESPTATESATEAFGRSTPRPWLRPVARSPRGVPKGRFGSPGRVAYGDRTFRRGGLSA